MKEQRSNHAIKTLKANTLLFLLDIITIFISVAFAIFMVYLWEDLGNLLTLETLTPFTGFIIFYIVIPIVFFSEGIYTYRFDFWHELRLIYKGLVLSMVIIFAYLAVTQTIFEYSRSIIFLSFLLMGLLMPLFKYGAKIKMYDVGLWKLGVTLLYDDPDREEKIFRNPYLGYIKSSRADTSIVFIDSHKNDFTTIRKELEREIGSKNKVMFVPVMDNYQFSSSDIFEIDNIKSSLIVLSNKLNTENRRYVNITYNYLLALISFPLLLPIIAVIAYLIKIDSKGSVFFVQDRLGYDGEIFKVIKFRTMHVNGDEILEEYLIENPREIENYTIYCKYENDPRITKIGHFLRKTSLDELAQIFNVLKGEMNFVGPRPYLVSEKEKIGEESVDVILKTKPGITGLWQVSGRNNLTFEERVQLDKWYIYNWSLWNDFVILLKTFKAVLVRSGAK